MSGWAIPIGNSGGDVYQAAVFREPLEADAARD
jgi:hypothetical protein